MSPSDDPHDKLKACLNHGWPDPDEDFSPDYLAACKRWFEALSPRARNTAVPAIAAPAQQPNGGICCTVTVVQDLHPELVEGRTALIPALVRAAVGKHSLDAFEERAECFPTALGLDRAAHYRRYGPTKNDTAHRV